jgi:hypothetical protein
MCTEGATPFDVVVVTMQNEGGSQTEKKTAQTKKRELGMLEGE